MVKYLVSTGSRLFVKKTLLPSGRVELPFLVHLYITAPKLQAKHENVTVVLECTVLGTGGMIICGQGTVKYYTQVIIATLNYDEMLTCNVKISKF